MSLTRHIAFICLIGMLTPLARADISAEIAEASAPLPEGVPEVAVVRLQALLSRHLPDAERRALAQKHAHAHLAPREPEHTLVLLADARVRQLPWAKFWR